MAAHQTAAEYYKSLPSQPALAEKFCNIDDAHNFRQCQQTLLNSATRNFVLDFGDQDAWCGFDLQNEEFVSLMKDQALANQYGLSYRLVKMMCTDPVRQMETAVAEPNILGESVPTERSEEKAQQNVSSGDLEGAYHLGQLDPVAASAEVASLGYLSFSNIINQIWHFCSVDYGPKYTCVGYNSLYTVKISGKILENGKGLPEGKRLWCWIILCDDAATRRNVVSIFSGASKQHPLVSDNESLVSVRVRHFSSIEPDDASIKQEDGPGLILYYMFDDWVSSYRLVARREHRYGALLDELRQNMLTKPNVDLVDDLHWLGRRLAILKHLYQSYELVITRILQRQRVLRDEAAQIRRENRRNTNVSNDLEFPDPAHTSFIMADVSRPYDYTAGVQLTSAAVGRFERLADRIRLYCLSEIETCLTEKETLTFMNFNLIALKDSQAVEKLTRITILLAKATIMFLPVSLMSQYFSIQIPDIGGPLSLRAYWISFAVLMVLSISILTLFGYLSDTVEGKTIYRSVTRTLFSSSKQKSMEFMSQRRMRR
uniref:ADP-ribosylation factor n=1 Tax=Talaromyces marneffei PM1 TaxID=1077442 RepID=A0A093VCL7_TALMA